MVQKIVRLSILCIHLIVNAAWLGAVLAMLVLVSANDKHSDLAAFALNDIAVWTSLVVLATSLAFALFTPWGFFRFRWVSAKWVFLASFAVMGTFARTPAINALAAAADVGAFVADRGAAMAWLLIESAGLITVFVLSLVKPWGRTTHTFEPGRSVRAGIGVSFAVVALFAGAQSMALASMRRTSIENVSPRELADGIYEGAATLGVHARVAVHVHGGRIERVDVLELPSGHYPNLARGVGDEVVRAQRLDVDGVTGATTSSRAIQKAAASALREAAAPP